MSQNPYETPQSPEVRPSEDLSRQTRGLTAQELFGVVVRTTALLMIAYGIWGFMGAALPATGYTAQDYVVGSLPLMLIGVAFFMGADLIVALAYHFRR
jgi:hypothetical protein